MLAIYPISVLFFYAHFNLPQSKYEHIVCIRKFLKNEFPLYQEKYIFLLFSSLMVLMRLFSEVHLISAILRS